LRGVLCIKFIKPSFTGVFNNPAIGGVTIETPHGGNPASLRREGGHTIDLYLTIASSASSLLPILMAAIARLCQV